MRRLEKCHGQILARQTGASRHQVTDISITLQNTHTQLGYWGHPRQNLLIEPF